MHCREQRLAFDFGRAIAGDWYVGNGMGDKYGRIRRWISAYGIRDYIWIPRLFFSVVREFVFAVHMFRNTVGDKESKGKYPDALHPISGNCIYDKLGDEVNMTNVKKKWMKMWMKKWIDAYFTVEAALIIPLVMAVIIFLMYMMFYQYNRCLMEQDLGVLLIKGSVWEVESAKDRVQSISANEEKRNYDKYLIWEKGVVTAVQEKGKLTVSQRGQLMFPFAGWQIKGADRVWMSEAEYKSKLLSPTFFVRSCRKIIRDTKEDEQ